MPEAAGDLRRELIEWLGERVDEVGFAPVERFDAAPAQHQPSRLCKDAQTVIVLAKAIPMAVLTSPGYQLYLLQRSYHTVYTSLDGLALELSTWLEKQGQPAVPVPSYAPLSFHDGTFWGLLSLKHAAVAAGLGSLGRNELVYHPEYGSMLRFGAVVTAAGLEGDPVREADPCPPHCHACRERCPVQAWGDDDFQRRACTSHAITHTIYRLALRDEEGLRDIETVINTAGYNYWIKCAECQASCPLNRGASGAPR
jgi:epoxyqueuosine reductase